MAKVGTAHVEIKPMLGEEALVVMCQRVEDEVAKAVARGIERGTRAAPSGTCSGCGTSLVGKHACSPGASYA